MKMAKKELKSDFVAVGPRPQDPTRICWKNPNFPCRGVTPYWGKSWKYPEGAAGMEIPISVLSLDCQIFCEFEQQEESK
jgi:hypothetical protein